MVVLDLFEEFRALTSTLATEGAEYALCGGMAMAVHGAPRATVDIDLLVSAPALPGVVTVARRLGFSVEALPMTFVDGAVVIRRFSKLDGDDLLSLDLLVVTPATQAVWETRQLVEWEDGRLCVVSREGLVALKRLRGSAQDVADIARLEEEPA